MLLARVLGEKILLGFLVGLGLLVLLELLLGLEDLAAGLALVVHLAQLRGALRLLLQGRALLFEDLL